MTDYTLGKLARELGVKPMEMYTAAVSLKVVARKMSARLSGAEVERLRARFTRSAVPTAGPTRPTETKGSDKSAYLAAARPRALPEKTDAQPAHDQGLCECCEIALTQVQIALARRVCLECEPHRRYHGVDRALVLASAHAKYFRVQFERSQVRLSAAIEHEGRAVQRSNRWVSALVRVIHQHGYTEACRICGTTQAPCPVWRRLKSVNRGIATKIINEFYQLSEDQLRRKLSDGYYESVYEQDPEPAD